MKKYLLVFTAAFLQATVMFNLPRYFLSFASEEADLETYYLVITAGGIFAVLAMYWRSGSFLTILVGVVATLIAATIIFWLPIPTIVLFWLVVGIFADMVMGMLFRMTGPVTNLMRWSFKVSHAFAFPKENEQ